MRRNPRIATWLRRHLAYVEMSTLTLRGMLGALVLLDALPEQREAISYELAMRAWADAVSNHIEMMTCWMRGGRS